MMGYRPATAPALACRQKKKKTGASRRRFVRSWLFGGIIVALLLGSWCTPGGATAVGEVGQSDGRIWRDAGEPVSIPPGKVDKLPDRYRLLEADEVLLKAVLDAAPQEGSDRAVHRPAELDLPLVDGTFARFQIEAYEMMEPGLAHKFPTWQSYLGWGLDDPTARVRVAWTSAGLNAAILSTDGVAYVAPYRRGDVTHYIAFDARDARKEAAGGEEELVLPSGSGTPLLSTLAVTGSNALRRSYRLAVAATGEFTQDHGGTVTDTLAVIVANVNELNGIFETELSVRFLLVNGNEQLVYTDPDTDPYTDGEPDLVINENQSNLDTVIGSENYDVGHCFFTGGSGTAMSSSVCTRSKARSASSGSVLLMAHELGHQFSSLHTHNSYGGCGRMAEQAYEPGTGSTLMAYPGRCNQSVLDPWEEDVPYFHTSTFARILGYIGEGAGSSCSLETDPGNSAPAVEAGPDYTIPHGTPFVLTGSGSDPDGDALTYTWEELDQGPEPFTIQLPNTDADGYVRPIFRSFPPVVSPVRVFPRLDSILDGSKYGRGEALPAIDRRMQFRLTARDGRGGVSYDSTIISVTDEAGPFEVTSPAGVETWQRGSRQTIHWSVANTNAAPVNCSTVDILLSMDGGSTFPITLTAATPNDGSEVVTVPDVEPIGAIVQIKCADSIFFDIGAGRPAICTSVFHDGHEEGFSKWTIWNAHGENSWQGRQDGGFSGQNYFFVDDRNEVYTDSYLESPLMRASGSSPTLSFVHRYQMELLNRSYASDAGVVEIRVNGGEWIDVGSTSFVQSGYNTVVASDQGSYIRGQPAFSGESQGYVLSVVDLDGLVADQDTFQVRFRQVKDGSIRSGDEEGWRVDDIVLCHGDPTPILSIDQEVLYDRLPIEIGDALTYTVVVTNRGMVDAIGVHVTDRLPAAVQGEDLDQVVTITARSSITWTIAVTLNSLTPAGPIVNVASYLYSSPQYCPGASRCSGSARVEFYSGQQFFLALLFRGVAER